MQTALTESLAEHTAGKHDRDILRGGGEVGEERGEDGGGHHGLVALGLAEDLFDDGVDSAGGLDHTGKR